MLKVAIEATTKVASTFRNIVEAPNLDPVKVWLNTITAKSG